tara:strand:- start:593 stop:781 length:189 start_codon:yes stop_codon:yes gene_type:complete
MVDKYTKTVLTVIAVGLWIQVIQDVTVISPAKADDYDIINRILFCIDGSTISDGRLSTYCDG